MQRSKVLLPEPLAPISEITSPSRAVRDTPLSTSMLPKRLCRRSTSIMVRAVTGSLTGSLDTRLITGLGAGACNAWTKSRIRWEALANTRDSACATRAGSATIQAMAQSAIGWDFARLPITTQRSAMPGAAARLRCGCCSVRSSWTSSITTHRSWAMASPAMACKASGLRFGPDR
ncbi:hypothetical protein D3C76_1187420 [compost metagenome]